MPSKDESGTLVATDVPCLLCGRLDECSEKWAKAIVNNMAAQLAGKEKSHSNADTLMETCDSFKEWLKNKY